MSFDTARLRHLYYVLETYPGLVEEAKERGAPYQSIQNSLGVAQDQKEQVAFEAFHGLEALLRMFWQYRHASDAMIETLIKQPLYVGDEQVETEHRGDTLYMYHHDTISYNLTTHKAEGKRPLIGKLHPTGLVWLRYDTQLFNAYFKAQFELPMDKDFWYEDVKRMRRTRKKVDELDIPEVFVDEYLVLKRNNIVARGK